MVKKIILWALVIGCMALIFSFSAQGADDSMDLSDGLLHAILRVLHISLPESVITFLRVFIRKVAHFSIYMLLGFFMYLLMHTGYSVKEKASAWQAVLYSFLYAVTDEVHQMFVPGRSCMLKDVVIDTWGASFGVAIAFGICFLLIRRRKNG